MALATATDGSLLLAVDRELPTVQVHQIYAWRYNPDNGFSELTSGSTSDGGVSNTSENSVRPTIAQDALGSTYVAWAERVGINTDGDALFQPRVRVLANGTWKEILCPGIPTMPSARVYVTAKGSAVYIGWAEILRGSSIWAWDGTSCASVSTANHGWVSTDYTRSMAATTDGGLFVTGLAQNAGKFKVFISRYANGSWTRSTFDDPRFADAALAFLAIDAQDAPTVATIDNGYGAGDVFAFNYIGGRWLDVGGNVSASSAMAGAVDVAVDSFGYPAVTWFDLGSTDVLLKRWNGHSWVGYGPLGTERTVVGTLPVDSSRGASIASTAYGLCLAWIDGSTLSVRCERYSL